MRHVKFLIPMAGCLVLGLILVSRDRTSASPRPSRDNPVRPSSRRSVLPREAAPPATTPTLKKSSPETLQRASEDARIRSTYENYRSAVVLENHGLERSLRPVLLRDRETSFRLAREEFQRATEPQDRQVAQNVLNALGGK